MPYQVGERVHLTRKRGVPAGCCGTVRKVYKNGNYRVRFTHGPDGEKLDFPTTLSSVPPDYLDDCDC
jgi:hypothetical protein